MSLVMFQLVWLHGTHVKKLWQNPYNDTNIYLIIRKPLVLLFKVIINKWQFSCQNEFINFFLAQG
jgi:hypothetical protein